MKNRFQRNELWIRFKMLCTLWISSPQRVANGFVNLVSLQLCMNGRWAAFIELFFHLLYTFRTEGSNDDQHSSTVQNFFVIIWVIESCWVWSLTPHLFTMNDLGRGVKAQTVSLLGSLGHIKPAATIRWRHGGELMGILAVKFIVTVSHFPCLDNGIWCAFWLIGHQK